MAPPPRNSSRLIWVSLSLALSLFSVPAAGQTLPLIVVSADDGQTGWWTTAPDFSLSELDQSLLADTRVDWVDPTRLENPPTLSRIYATTALSLDTARNLANLFHARSVLVGEAELTSPQLGPGEMFWIATGEVHFQVTPVDIEVVEVAAEVSLSALGATPEAARARLLAALAEAVADRLQGGDATVTPTPISSEDPVLVLMGVGESARLVAFKGALRARSDVVSSVDEVWATEGAIALGVRLEGDSRPAHLEGVLDELARDPSWGYTLTYETQSDGTTAVYIELLTTPPALPPGPPVN